MSTSLDNLRDALIAADMALHTARRELPALAGHRGFFKLADALEHTRQSLKALDAAADALVPVLPYNTPGHVCPDTGRICMTVREAFARDDSPDRHFFQYNGDASHLGLDPWRLLDGIDASTAKRLDGTPAEYTLYFDASDSTMKVGPNYVLYMQRTAAERAA
jgi:hypothetical protein